MKTYLSTTIGGLRLSALIAVFAAMGVGFSPVQLSAQGLTATASAVQPGSSLALVPWPREVHELRVLSLANGVGVSAAGHDAEDEFAAADLIATLKERGVEAREATKGDVKVVLLRADTRKAADVLMQTHLTFDAAMHDEGYVIVTAGKMVYDIAATGAGIYYGAQTIQQLIVGRGDAAVLHAATIRDWPAMKYRGVSDDISRGPIPTLAFQKHEIRVLSQYKVNIYSPYFENTLAYASNPLMAPPGGAMTRADVAELVRYATQYHVTIVPEQEAFGHLHHALTFDVYSKLAETPHGSVLAPGQAGSLVLIQQLFTEIAAMFPGPFLHIGADETFELGSGQTKAAVEKEGISKVYIEFVTQIAEALKPLHKRILFWGDIAMKDPQLVKTMPKDLIAVAWVYEEHPEGYDQWLRPYTDAGLETWVAPGISNWGRVTPDNNRALDNIQRFVSDGQRMGSTGELNTVWCDDGEGITNQNWYGLLFGAAAGWQSGSSSIPQFQQSYGQIFHGDESGKINEAQIKLMAAQKTLTAAGAENTNNLFWMDPWSADGQIASAQLLPVMPAMRVQAEQAIILIEQARAAGNLRENDALDAMEMGARRLDFIGFKFETAQEIVTEYNRAYLEQSDPKHKDDVAPDLGNISYFNGQCQDIRDGFGLTRDLYREAWLKENRPYWLDNMTGHYDLEMQRWIQRGLNFEQAHREWDRTSTLPKPEDLGLPALPNGSK